MWTDAKKTKSLNYGDTFTSATLPSTFYVEGIKSTTATQGPGGASTPLDVSVYLVYSLVSGGSVKGTVSFAVTPVIDYFQTTTGSVNILMKGTAPDTAGIGLITTGTTPGGVFGITFDVQLDVRNVLGSPVFVQNGGVNGGVTGIGSVNAVENATLGGFTYKPGKGISPKNAKLIDLTVVPNKTYDTALDMADQQKPQPPYYQSRTVEKFPDHIIFTASDQPGSIDSNLGDAVWLTNQDDKFNFRMYLEWRYSTVIYTLATLDWSVVFKGTGAGDGHGLNSVSADSKVSAMAFDPKNHTDPIVETDPNALGRTFNNLLQTL
jgi:hypothetical protein